MISSPPPPPTLWFGHSEDAPDSSIVVDLHRLLETRLIVTGSSGAGKSRMIRSIAEQTYGRVQQIILDHDGDFYTLAERNSYLLCGAEGYAPVTEETADPLANLLYEHSGVSAVLDLSGLPLPRRFLFVRRFCESLMRLVESVSRGQARSARLLVIDECQLYSPERGMGDAESKAAIVDIATRGRKYGLCLVASCQRLSDMSKQVTDQCNNKVVGYADAGPSLDSSAALLGFTGQVQKELIVDLEPHTFYARGPAIHRRPLLVRTGETYTTHPKMGEIVPPVPPAPEALRDLAAQLSSGAAAATSAVQTEEGAGRDIEAIVEERVTAKLSEETQRLEDTRRTYEELSAQLETVRREVHIGATKAEQRAADAEQRAAYAKLKLSCIQRACGAMLPLFQQFSIAITVLSDPAMNIGDLVGALDRILLEIRRSAAEIDANSEVRETTGGDAGTPEPAVVVKKWGDAGAHAAGAPPDEVIVTGGLRPDGNIEVFAKEPVSADGAQHRGGFGDEICWDDLVGEEEPEPEVPSGVDKEFEALRRQEGRRIRAELKPAHRTFLDVLASFEAIGVKRLDRDTLTVLSGYKVSSSQPDNHLAYLKNNGLVEYPGQGTVALTRLGRAAAAPIPPALTLADLHRRWLSILDTGPAKLLRELLHRRTQGTRQIPRASLFAACGFSLTSSQPDNHAATLKKYGIIRYPAPATIELTDLLFPEGLK